MDNICHLHYIKCFLWRSFISIETSLLYLYLIFASLPWLSILLRNIVFDSSEVFFDISYLCLEKVHNLKSFPWWSFISIEISSAGKSSLYLFIIFVWMAWLSIHFNSHQWRLSDDSYLCLDNVYCLLHLKPFFPPEILISIDISSAWMSPLNLFLTFAQLAWFFLH